MKSLFNVIFFVAVSLLLLFASGNLLAQADYDTVSIHDLQFVPDPGTNDASPYNGQTVVVRGMMMTHPRDLWVGARWASYIVDPDSFPNPWSGFFIIQNDTFATQTGFQFLQPGDIAYFTGTVDEFSEFTEVALLTNPAVPVDIVGTGTFPSPLVLTNADLTQAEGEQWESMWVKLMDETVVNNNISGNWASINDASSTTYLAEYFHWFYDRLPSQYQWPSNGVTLNVQGFTQDASGTPGQVFVVNPRDTFDIEITGDPPPVITSASRTPGAPTSSDNVVVFGTIVDNGSVQSATLKYSVNEGSFQDISMTNTSGDIYSGTIPAQSDGDFVRYFIYAEDNLSGSITDPGDTSRVSGRVYFYTVRDGGLQIADVQSTHGYALDNSGYQGYEVTLQGVINTDSTDFVGDYYMQDAAALWSGIWVNDDPNTYAKGDEVSVTGTIVENFNVTRINVTSSSLVTAGVGEFSPLDVTTGEVTTGGVNSEASESVLIRVQNVTVTDPFPDGYPGFGEFAIDDGSGEIRVDDLASAYSGQGSDTTYALGNHIDYLIALGYYSFGNAKLIPRDSLDVGPVTGIKSDKLAIPEDFVLRQNYPNPFNPTTEIEYNIASSGDFNINIYNILGQKVRTLVNERHSVGNYKIQWDGTDSNRQQVGSGIYFYSLKGKDVSLTKKMILLK